MIGVVAQRLVRRICDSCREPYEPSSDELAFYEEWGGKPKDEFTHGAGCNFCAQHGLRRPRRRVRAAQGHAGDQAADRRARASRRDLRSARIDEGMRTLRDEALRLIEEDVTTIGEVLRSVYIS